MSTGLLYRPGTSTDIPTPDDPRFIPAGSPEPAHDVQAVAILEEDPSRQRWVRTTRGWRMAGVLASVGGGATPAVVPWAQVGRCWSGTAHNLKDVTHRPGCCGNSCGRCSGPGCGCCGSCG